MQSNAYAIILAGGKGERFWPMSTAARPKQLLSIVGGEPLVAAAVRRLNALIPADRVFVITRDEIVGAVRAAVPDLPAKNIIGEPVGRDTAAAITLGAALVKARDPDASFCVLTADHVIGDASLFNRTLSESFVIAASGVLVTIGMKPSFASIGFGYIEAGNPIAHPGETEFFKAKRFVEKPDIETAKRYLKLGSFYWNSGMFIWSVKTYEAALAAHCPALLDMMKKIEPMAGGPGLAGVLASVYPGLEKISIDYALMEKAGNVVMAKGVFEWDDVGSWTALENHIEKDAAGNATLGQVESIDSSGNVVVAEQGLVALCGVKDLVVVRTENATLVCPKDRAQDVKRIVELLKADERHGKLL